MKMAYNESLAERIRVALTRKKGIKEKKMFGGVCFLLNGNMLVGVWKEFLIARLGPEQGGEALHEPHVRAFDITGKPMRNWVAVEPEGVEDDDQLEEWIQRAVKFVKTLPKK
jgi:TfoX/Sxy family transcriptional regulator of competence genes